MENMLQMLRNCGAASAGAVPVSRLRARMAEAGAARAQKELPGVQSLMCAVFPYFIDFLPGNISLYARGQDYHHVLGRRLEFAAQSFRRSRPEYDFRVYIDASPYPEVYAASLCGLGAIGRNGLLITPRHGSLVFIGTIASTMPLGGSYPPTWCIDCGKCLLACPTGALGADGLDREKCLSHITQLRGALTKEQQAAVEKGGMLWGCDVCQKVCPLNRDMPPTDLPEFGQGLIRTLEAEDLELGKSAFRQKHGDRAFLWRGLSPLRRNMRIIAGK